MAAKDWRDGLRRRAMWLSYREEQHTCIRDREGDHNLLGFHSFTSISALS
jgi:hypothetical protein